MATTEAELGRGVQPVSDSGSGSRQASGQPSWYAPAADEKPIPLVRGLCAATRFALARSVGLGITELTPPGKDGRVKWKIDRLVAPGDGKLVLAAASRALKKAFGFRATLDIAIALAGPMGLGPCGLRGPVAFGEREIDGRRIREVLHEWGEADGVPSAPLQAASRLVEEFLDSEDAVEAILRCAGALLFDAEGRGRDFAALDDLAYVYPEWDESAWADTRLSITLDPPRWTARCRRCKRPVTIAVLAPAAERPALLSEDTVGVGTTCARCGKAPQRATVAAPPA